MREISMVKVIKTLSGIMDLLSSSVVSHHKKVSYIAYKIASEMKLEREELNKLIIASIIHDIGVFYLNVNLDSSYNFDDKDNLHAEVGYYLIREHKSLREVAEIIRYHHSDWDQYSSKIPLVTNILHLADKIAFMSEKYDVYYDNKRIKQIVSRNSGSRFWPEAVSAYQQLSKKEYFHLDIKSPKVINRELDTIMSLLDEKRTLDDLLDISKIISYIVDFRSSFTTTHSIGIAEVSKELFKLMNFSLEEQLMIEIAGYLHDIGKLLVPSDILNKAGKLNTKEWKIMRSHTYYTYQVLESLDELADLKEWAAYHHETLDGKGYPFHLKANQLSQGARVMAVADIFTAITEDRPYRKGMEKNKVLNVLKNLIINNKLDRDIVNLLIENYHHINDIRQEIQSKARIQYHSFRSKIDKNVNNSY